MSRQSGQRMQVPDDLREVLLEFTISYLLEQPGDMISYAADYFQRLREDRTTTIVYATEGSQGSYVESVPSVDDDVSTGRVSTRRKPVYAEAYNPEEDNDEDDADQTVYPKTEAQRERLGEAVKHILLFKSLDSDQMNNVIDAMFERKVVKDEYVIQQGDDGDNFYVIESGLYNVFVSTEPNGEPKHVFTYENAGSFGELALLYNMPRAATIQATTEGSLWAMDRQTFRRIVLKSAFKKRKMYEALIESVPMLKTLQPYERMNLADALIPKTLKDGETVIKQNDAADGMYFIEDGIVVVTILDDSGNDIEINRMGKGGYFGELALVTHRPRAATVRCEGNVKLAFLEVDAFERLLGPCMNIMKRNIADYEEQMQKIFGPVK